MYQRTWHGIDLTTLPAAAGAVDQPASAEFYAQFYQALAAGQGRIDPQWLESKRQLGSAIERGIIHPWQREHGRSPRILALAAGKASAERVWIERGYEVTFNDCQEDSLTGLRNEFPAAKLLIGDVRDLRPPEQFEFITMLTLDYVMSREELIGFLSKISSWLTPDGHIILYCASTLSYRQILVEALKHLLGKYRRTAHVFWGYWRTPREFESIARRAGLRTCGSQQLSNSPEQPLKDRGALSCFPPLRDSNLVITLKRN